MGAIHCPHVHLNSCVTKGALAFTNQEYPGAFLKEDGVSYVPVVGITSKTTHQINENRQEADE
eukprot:14615852-Ditylum_brightwellii.AAC.1